MMVAPQMALTMRMLWRWIDGVTMRYQYDSVESEIIAYTRFSFDQCVNIVKRQCENDVEVQSQWRLEYAIESPTRLTIVRIHDKFETRGTVCDVRKG